VNKDSHKRKAGLRIRTYMKRTFATHAGLETLFEATVLTLIAVMLINGTVTIAAARVREITTH